ncbi:hypothetical protein PFAG_03511 [Plasmodium falciparum Santa Lucia]|uniref:Uncharacterized protein n=1 Tax=Plasmodium falciparum Santa Lucia TaxID=478859 RepID=W7FWP1_PLAFA|nr:hypothetical protein PFAG_03511 [Plasmodium falciparum Santa Lucia]
MLIFAKPIFYYILLYYHSDLILQTLRFYNCTNNNQEKVLISLEEFFIALQKAIHKETINKSKLSEQKNTKS